MLQMMYMAEVMQIIGAILLIAIGVGVILYTLLRKSPTAAREEEMRAIEEAEDAEAESDAEIETVEAEDAEAEEDAQ